MVKCTQSVDHLALEHVIMLMKQLYVILVVGEVVNAPREWLLTWRGGGVLNRVSVQESRQL